MKIFRYFYSIPWYLYTLLIISLAIILLIDFWLVNVYEIVSWGTEFGKIVYNLSFAYLSAFIFYFLVSHYPKMRDKDNVYPYFSLNVYRVINDGKKMIVDMTKNTNISLVDEYPSENELKSILSEINPHSESPLANFTTPISYQNWLLYIENVRIRTQQFIEPVLAKLIYLDSEVVKTLSKLNDNSLFFSNQTCIRMGVRFNNRTFTNHFISFQEYFKLIEELDIYYCKYLAQYR